MPIVFLVVLASLFTGQKPASQNDVGSEPPALGATVTKAILTARHGNDTCLTATSRYDPCAQISADHISYVVAWDKTTNKITYVFTSDLSFVTDGELGIGGTVRLDRRKLVAYKSWLLAPDSADTANGEGTGNKWYPVVTLLDLPSMDPNMTYASISGFVQSDYLTAMLQQQPTKAPQ